MYRDGFGVWRMSHTAFVVAELGLPTNLWMGRSWLFPTSSIRFFTRRSLKSRWVYLASHEGNRIQLLSNVRSRRWKNIFVIHLKVCGLIRYLLAMESELSMYPCAGRTIPWCEVSRVVALVTKISFCWWWVHNSQHVNFSTVLPN